MSTESGNNIFLFLELLARRRAFILTFVTVVTLLAVVISFLLPKWYTATALILPSHGDAMPIGKYTQLSQISSLTSGLELPALVTPADVHARVLKSRTITDRIIDKFDLMTRYGASQSDEAYEALMEHSELNATEEGLLQIEVEDRDPRMAADIANAFVSELNIVAREFVSGRAKQKRLFIEDRLQSVKAELDSARLALQTFQLENRTVDLDEQTKLAISQAVALKVELAQIDVRIAMDERILGSDNQELLDAKQRRRIIQKQLSTLEHGGVDTSFFAMPLASVPTLKGRYENLLSKVTVSETLYEVLLEQYEQAKIEEGGSTPSVTVIDSARVPEMKSRPQRTVIVAVSFVGALIVGLLLAAVFNYLERMSKRDDADYQRIQSFLRAYAGWMPGFRRHAR